MTGKAGLGNFGHLGHEHRPRLPVAELQLLDIACVLGRSGGREERNRNESKQRSIHETPRVAWARQSAKVSCVAPNFGQAGRPVKYSVGCIESAARVELALLTAHRAPLYPEVRQND